MLNFELNNKTKSKANLKQIESINNNFYKAAGLKGEWEYSLAFVGEQKIRSLNRIFRGKDRVTDVLSFEESKDEFISGPAERKNLGEIIICISRAKNQARKYGWTLNREISRLLVHGLSHLLGYDHENVSQKQAQKMFDFEAKVNQLMQKNRDKF